MMRRLAIVSLVACLLLSFDAHAEVDTASGNQWIEYCAATEVVDTLGAKTPLDKLAIAIRCQSFVLGFRRGYEMAVYETATRKRMGTSSGHKFTTCIPKEATTAQLVKVLLGYLRSHPEELHLDIGLLAWGAFLEAWPCK